MSTMAFSWNRTLIFQPKTRTKVQKERSRVELSKKQAWLIMIGVPVALLIFAYAMWTFNKSTLQHKNDGPVSSSEAQKRVSQLIRKEKSKADETIMITATFRPSISTGAKKPQNENPKETTR